MNEQQIGILEQAIATYGTDYQLNIAIEELSELIKAICKYKRVKPDEACYLQIAGIIEETADVLIMIEQIKIIMGEDDLIASEIDRKIKRLSKKLEDEKCLS
jgi:NTP pyrophosphatase (non-canonical NTP hydrolase)